MVASSLISEEAQDLETRERQTGRQRPTGQYSTEVVQQKSGTGQDRDWSFKLMYNNR